MTLRTERGRRERILVFGAPKSGKSRCWTSIAEHSTAKLHVIDTDYRAYQSMEHLSDEAQERVIVYQPNTWLTVLEDVAKAQADMERDDWLVLDQATHAWQYVITYYIEQVMGKKPGDFFLDFKKGGGKGNPMAGAYGENWNVINAMYRDWIMSVIRTRGHLLGIAASKKIDAEQDDINTKKLFGPHGYKPDGQKDLGYQFDSILLTGFGKTSSDYQLTTVGDTNRDKMVEIKHNDFALDYLVLKAGWKL